jgi:hypothetical protein
MQAVVKSQKMQCKQPSKYKVQMESNYYDAAVDLYDKRTTDILLSCLNTLCRKDEVTLSTFGSHVHRIHIQMNHDEWDAMKRVSKELSRICTRIAPPFKSDFMKPCAMVE